MQVLPQRVAKHQGGICRRDDQDERQNGQQPTRAAQPEPGQVGVGGALALGNQQCCDQKSRDDEEDINAKKSRRQPGDTRVKQHYGERRKPTDPVKACQVRQTALAGCRISSWVDSWAGHRRLHPEDAEVRLRHRRIARSRQANGECLSRVDRIEDAVVPDSG